MSSMLEAVGRVALLLLGAVVLLATQFRGWGALLGIAVVGVGTALILAASRRSALAARLELRRERFGHVRFPEDEDDDELPRSPWSKP